MALLHPVAVRLAWSRSLRSCAPLLRLCVPSLTLTSQPLPAQVAIVVKYFFQFGFFPWNKNVELYKDKPYHPPNIIGVEKKEGYVLYDLIQLLALFFHRSILKVGVQFQVGSTWSRRLLSVPGDTGSKAVTAKESLGTCP